MIIILSSPSGGGKTSIAKKILENDKDITLSISITTRKPRSNESEAKDYFFKTIKEFKQLKNSGKLLEDAKVYDNFYGTPKDYVYKMLDEGRDVLFDIDHQGAKQIKDKLTTQVVSIFIMPPSLDILEKRLTSRGKDNLNDIKKRLNVAKEVMSHSDSYDYVVINDQFETAVSEIEKIIEQERSKR